MLLELLAYFEAGQSPEKTKSFCYCCSVALNPQTPLPRITQSIAHKSCNTQS